MVAMGADRGGHHRDRTTHLVVDPAPAETARGRRRRSVRAGGVGVPAHRGAPSYRSGRTWALRHAHGRGAARLSRRAIRGGFTLADDDGTSTRRAGVVVRAARST